MNSQVYFANQLTPKSQKDVVLLAMTDKHDLTELQCKRAFAAGKVVWVQGNPNDLSIIFFTDKTDKGFVKTSSGGIKRYSSKLDRDWAITRIRGI